MKKNLMIRWGSAFLVSIVELLIAASRTSPVYDLLLGDYGNNTASAAMVIGKCWIVLGLVSSVIAYVALCAAGNSAFEWCLPFIAGGYWIALRKKRLVVIVMCC